LSEQRGSAAIRQPLHEVMILAVWNDRKLLIPGADLLCRHSL